MACLAPCLAQSLQQEPAAAPQPSPQLPASQPTHRSQVRVGLWLKTRPAQWPGLRVDPTHPSHTLVRACQVRQVQAPDQVDAGAGAASSSATDLFSGSQVCLRSLQPPGQVGHGLRVGSSCSAGRLCLGRAARCWAQALAPILVCLGSLPCCCRGCAALGLLSMCLPLLLIACLWGRSRQGTSRPRCTAVLNFKLSARS